MKKDIIKINLSEGQREAIKKAKANLENIFSEDQREAIKKLSQQIKAAEHSYNEEFESIKEYLRVNGYIKPKDFNEFMWWIYLEKLKQEQLYPVPKITDTLFIEYHEYREHKLLSNTKHKIQCKSVIPNFTNNFDNINPEEIYKYFKQGLVDKGYLTESDLCEYLKAAFELKKIPKILFKLTHTPNKQKIYIVFYTYYKDIAQKQHNRQTEYAALLGDYFEGYKIDIIKTNWARKYKPKR